MKKTLLTSMAAMALAATAYADGIQAGLADPEVIPPAVVESPIGGFYAGLSANQNKSKETFTETFEDCVYPEDEYQARRIVIVEPECKPISATSTETVSDEETKGGVFVGYRHAFDSLVVGAEFGTDGELSTLEAQVGLAITPNILAYGFAGGIDFDQEVQGQSYGVGVDYVANNGFLVGVRGMKAEIGSADLEQVGLRVGFSF